MAGAGDRKEAESDLREREKRHRKLELRTLSDSEREGFEHRWSSVQDEFVDDPAAAVRGADRLVVEVCRLGAIRSASSTSAPRTCPCSTQA